MKKRYIALFAVLGVIAATAIVYKKDTQERKKRELLNRHAVVELMLNQWIRVKQKGISISDYLIQKGYRKVAIYGMGRIGERLLAELNGSSVEALYGIDRNADTICSTIAIYHPTDKFPPVDAVIVTSVFDFDEIVGLMEKKIKCPLLSLEDILYEV